MTKKMIEYIETGSGARRRGHPRTDEERRRRHKKIHGNTKLPSRGTGLKNKKKIDDVPK